MTVVVSCVAAIVFLLITILILFHVKLNCKGVTTQEHAKGRYRGYFKVPYYEGAYN
jgi:hypothetical protein